MVQPDPTANDVTESIGVLLFRIKTDKTHPAQHRLETQF